MKYAAYFKSVVRKPVQAILLFLLIASISFAFISKLAEYLIVSRETDRLAGYYRSIGSLEPANYDADDVTAARALLSESPYVAFEDCRRACVATLDDIPNADIDGMLSDHPGKSYTSGVHVSDVVLYGVLQTKYRDDATGDYWLKVEVDRVECGYPEYVKAGDLLTLTARASDGDLFADLEQMEKSERYLLRAYFDPTLAKGWESAKKNLFLKPLDEGTLFLPAGADLNAPEHAKLRTSIDMLRQNLSAVVAVTTRDMSAMPLVQHVSDFYYLTDGRWLNAADDAAQNPVCVVHKEFAALRGLSVGDTLSLTVHDEPASFYGYLPDGSDYTAFKTRPTTPLTLTIVGTYGMLLSERYQPTQRNLVVYLPDSCMPAAYPADGGAGVTSGDYSFVLRSSRDEDAFLNEYKDALSALGFTVSFVPNNAANFWASVTPLRQSAVMGVYIWSAVLLVALSLAAFLYVMQRRREFAILRALGMPVRQASRGALLPIAVLGLLAVFGGGILAWRYALSHAANTLAAIALPEGASAAVDLNPLWLIGLAAAVFFMLMLLAGAGVRTLSRTSVLALLAGGASKRKRVQSADQARVETPKTGRDAAVQHASMAALLPELLFEPPRTRRAGTAARLRFERRQLARAPLKSLLCISVALLFAFALSWMNRTMQDNRDEIDRLYDTTVVTADIVQNSPSTVISGSGGGVISQKMIDAVMESGFVTDAYLLAAAEWGEVLPDGYGKTPEEQAALPVERFPTLYAFDRPERFFEENNVSVVYAPGWDASMFTEGGFHARQYGIVMAETMMDRLGLALGEQVELCDNRGGSASFTVTLAGCYAGGIRAAESVEPVLISLPLLRMYHAANEQETYYTAASFTFDPAQNRELPAFREKMQAAVKETDAGLLALDFLFWDEELTTVVAPMEKNVQLMEVLYPVTVALSAVIAAGLSALLLLQNARCAAIMRVLGASRKKVRRVLCSMQMLLTALGVLLGVACTMAVWRADALLLWKPLALCAALYLSASLAGSLAAALSVTAKMPLALLQVKE